ncbi:hypothetical protein, partial [Nitrosomonas halophila]|uniref:hypothetical protein n=1 Tax=Nitrosomonas halophila TaxID=44576 RepID=UPI001C4093FE
FFHPIEINRAIFLRKKHVLSSVPSLSDVVRYLPKNRKRVASPFIQRRQHARLCSEGEAGTENPSL